MPTINLSAFNPSRFRFLSGYIGALSAAQIAALNTGLLKPGATVYNTTADQLEVVDNAGNIVPIDTDTPPTRDVFFSPQRNGSTGEYRRRRIGGAGAFEFTFRVPHDFTSIISLVAIGIPTAGAAGAGKDIDLISNYASVGENLAFHSESDLGTVYDFSGTADEITNVLDLSIVFNSLSANDLCGVNIDHNGIGGAIDYLGIRLRYA